MLKQFIEAAKADRPVYITDVRKAFNEQGSRPFSMHLTLYSGEVRVFPLCLPETEDEEQEAFAASYINAMAYNLISSLGGVRLDVYTDKDDAKAVSLAKSLPVTFQAETEKMGRSGYGKCMNVNERVLKTLSGEEKRFVFAWHDCEDEPGVRDTEDKIMQSADFAAFPEKTKGRTVLGIDVGGTDIKLAASVDGHLAACKEFDWFPASFATAEEMIGPIMQLTRLMRAACALTAAGRQEEIDAAAMAKDATAAMMDAGITSMEETLGHVPENFDAIGLSFPDVVIRNLITGGECNKFKGMRDNPDLDFEEQYAKVTPLCRTLSMYVKEGGAVMATNDGPMAAFTAAVEMAAAGVDVSNGFFAHTLGTELGTGWVLPDGSIPEIPLEVYNFIIDLGSFRQKGFPADDVRSINNFNTDLPGTLQKYTGQSGVFRLAAKYLPEKDPAVYAEAFEKGFLKAEGDGLYVPSSPKDMRKPALEFFMEKAADEEHPACAEIFKEIGTYLAVTWQETDYILRPKAKERSLFGRLVKAPACYALMDEGARERVPGLCQYPADSTLANTPLMKDLAADTHYTVAQFAQAVGAVYFALS